jgi:hypothetical protein
MDKERYDWNQLSMELSKLLLPATDQQVWQMLHKIQDELMHRYEVDWRLYG